MRSTTQWEAASTAVLVGLLWYGILTLWVPARWALSAYQAGTFLLAAAWMLRLAAQPFPLVGSPALLPLFGMVGWGAVQVASRSTIYTWETWNAVLVWLTNAALFFVALQLFTDYQRRDRFVDVTLYFGFALSAVSTVQMFTAAGKVFWLFPSGYDGGVLGPFVSRNQYAAFIEMVLPVALYRALSDPPRALRYWGIAAVLVASVVAGASRAGTIMVLLEIVAVPMIAVARGMVTARTVALALGRFAVFFIIATTIVGWDVLWQRFQQPDPYAGRRELLLSSIAMVRDRPWTGFGLGTWSTAYPAYALYDDGSFANQAHNDWAQWAVEGGIPAVAMMLSFGVLMARPAVRSCWGIGLLAVLLHCVVDYPLQQRPALAGWFFALAGATAARRGKIAGDLAERNSRELGLMQVQAR